MEPSPSGTQKNGNRAVRTGRMLTDFAPWARTKLCVALWPFSIMNGRSLPLWFTLVCFLAFPWQSRLSIATVGWWKLWHVDSLSVWPACISMMLMSRIESLAKDQVNEPCSFSTIFWAHPSQLRSARGCSNQVLSWGSTMISVKFTPKVPSSSGPVNASNRSSFTSWSTLRIPASFNQELQPRSMAWPTSSNWEYGGVLVAEA